MLRRCDADADEGEGDRGDHALGAGVAVPNPDEERITGAAGNRQRLHRIAKAPVELAGLGRQCPHRAAELVQGNGLGHGGVQADELGGIVDLQWAQIDHFETGLVLARLDRLVHVGEGLRRPVGTRLGDAAEAEGVQLDIDRHQQQPVARGQGGEARREVRRSCRRRRRTRGCRRLGARWRAGARDGERRPGQAIPEPRGE